MQTLSYDENSVRPSVYLSNACKILFTSGVPQGSVLGPTLFLLFINDICDIFDGLHIKCKLYADDIKLYSC